MTDNPTPGNPDLEFIKKHVMIADVARLLDIRVDSDGASSLLANWTSKRRPDCLDMVLEKKQPRPMQGVRSPHFFET